MSVSDFFEGGAEFDFGGVVVGFAGFETLAGGLVSGFVMREFFAIFSWSRSFCFSEWC